MKDAMRVLPTWIGRGMSSMFFLHDLAFLFVAIFGAFSLPPSVKATLALYAWIWICTVGSGSIFGMWGTITRSVRLEVLGCGLMIGGLVVYATALLVRSTQGPASPALAAVGIFLAAAFSLGARIFVMFAAIYLREPKI